MKVITFGDIKRLIAIVGIKAFFTQLIDALEQDFSRWEAFHKSPRHAIHYPHGVIELMPCADDFLYAFKYVNGHPGNTRQGKFSIIAVGQLSEVATGYPLLLCDMTLLTAFRTAATGALAAKYLAREDASSLAIIGTGAQAEFQVLGFDSLFPLREVRFFDIDAAAMAKFSRNMSSYGFELMACSTIKDAIRDADIVVTATAAKKRQTLFELQDVAPGTHIHAMGGDCPGKTEHNKELLQAAKIVVEFLPQALQEGEVQQCDPGLIYAELWELAAQRKAGRENSQEITLFDAVGFALEDFSALRLVYQLAADYQLGEDIALLPEAQDPKNLFGLLSA